MRYNAFVLNCFRGLISSYLLTFLGRGKKNYMVLVLARTTFASRTAHFFIFLFHFLLP